MPDGLRIGLGGLYVNLDVAVNGDLHLNAEFILEVPGESVGIAKLLFGRPAVNSGQAEGFELL